MALIMSLYVFLATIFSFCLNYLPYPCSYSELGCFAYVFGIICGNFICTGRSFLLLKLMILFVISKRTSICYSFLLKKKKTPFNATSFIGALYFSAPIMSILSALTKLIALMRVQGTVEFNYFFFFDKNVLLITNVLGVSYCLFINHLFSVLTTIILISISDWIRWSQG